MTSTGTTRPEPPVIQGETLVCHRCGTPGPLADSHVIPAAFSRQIQGDSSILLQIGMADDAYQRKLRKGPYVTDLLCPACDNWLNQQYEQKAIQSLVQGRGITGVYLIQEGIQFWRMDAVDIKGLKLFLLSILWRAHNTQMDPYRTFNLRTAAGRIHEMVLAGDAGHSNEFPVIATRFDVNAALLMPHDYELEGVPYWEVNLGDWHFLVKASAQPTPPPFDDFEIKETAPNFVIPREFWGSGHHDLLKDMVLKNQEQRQRGRTESTV